MSVVNRYKEIFEIKKNTSNVPPPNVPPYHIKDRETDLHIVYRSFDRLDLISNRVYGSPDYWWVILGANNYTIEFDIEDGEILKIPYPLDDVLNEMRKQV